MLDSHHQVRTRAIGHGPESGYGFLQLARRDLTGAAPAARILGEPEGTQTGHAVKCSARFEHALGHPARRARGADGGRPLDVGSLGGGGVRMPGGPRSSKPVDRNTCKTTATALITESPLRVDAQPAYGRCQTVSMYRSNPVPARAPDRAGPLAGSTHANGAGEAGLQNAIHGLNGDAMCAHRLCPYPCTPGHPVAARGGSVALHTCAPSAGEADDRPHDGDV